MNYLRAARRFWWLVLAGLAAACGVLILTLYNVKRTWPPLLVKNAVHSYLATTELLVDSPTGPYLRSASDRQTSVRIPGKRTSEPAAPTATTEQGAVAATKPLVDAANLFPLLIESDAVARIRVERFGKIPGVVSAKALYAAQAGNRYRPSVLPVMQIAALSRKPENAIRLAGATARAFDIWLTREQNAGKVPRSQRIILRQLHAPRDALEQGGTRYGLPVLLAFALFGAFVGLAVLADHFFPRREEEAASGSGGGDSEDESQPKLTVAARSQSS